MLAKFDLKIVHKKGKLHTLPDALSRLLQIHHIFVIMVQGWSKRFSKLKKMK